MSEQMTQSRCRAVGTRPLVAMLVVAGLASMLDCLMSSDSAVAQPGAYRVHCASKHAAAVMLIEEQIVRGSVPEPILTERAFAVLSARNACMNGQLSRALNLYESVLSEVQKTQE
jgi:hypothetical protein